MWTPRNAGPTDQLDISHRDVEEFSYKEIANILNVAAGTVMSRISRGRRLLYRHLTEQKRDVAELRIVTGEAASC